MSAATAGTQPFTVLVMAKAPVAGRVKTRLAATTGPAVAADLAAAALLDTLAAVAATPYARGHLALAGTLAGACQGVEIGQALAGWTVSPQVGEDFAERLVHAHLEAGPGPVVQIGMDTPQVTPAHLLAAARPLADHDACLGPAPDGGWWALARRDPDVAVALGTVEMSTPHTCADTRAALTGSGRSVALTGQLNDVDDAADAREVARAAPGTRFAATWRAWEASR